LVSLELGVEEAARPQPAVEVALCSHWASVTVQARQGGGGMFMAGTQLGRWRCVRGRHSTRKVAVHRAGRGACWLGRNGPRKWRRVGGKEWE
jgi:hypothetical protein